MPAQAIRPAAELVAIHDSARPLVEEADVRRCLLDALEVRAAHRRAADQGAASVCRLPGRQRLARA